MPKPKKPCAGPGCPNLTTERYCKDHIQAEQIDRQQRNRHYDQHQRDQRAKVFYNSKEWETARQQTLIRDFGLCQKCLKHQRITLADMVHHRFPIATYWEYRLILTNLVSLCNSCHAKIDHAALEK